MPKKQGFSTTSIEISEKEKLQPVLRAYFNVRHRKQSSWGLVSAVRDQALNHGSLLLNDSSLLLRKSNQGSD